MGFKLVRTDSVEVCKIKLPAGKHVIGRGKLLDCNDKRVSRSHGVLEVTQDTVFVKALHQNPCFFIKKGTKETKIIKQDCAQEIGNGDRFGLLPDLYWYELICCTFVDDDQHQLLDIGEIKTDADSVKTEPFEFENMDTYQENFNLNDTDVNDKTGSPSLLPPEDQDTASADKECSPHLKSPNKRSLNSDREDSCSAVKKSKTDVEEPNVKQEPAASPGPVVMKEPNDEQDINNSDKQESNDEQDINNSDKQVPNEEQNINNSVKQEPNNEPDLKDSVTQEPNDGQDLNNSAAGAGNDQAGTSGTNDKGTADSSANSTRKRERCMYGANCYRRNPHHKAQFSHPADGDWGSGARAACPWGAACRRRDARHWRDHDHPPGTAPPPHQRHNPGKKGKKLTKRVSGSDDDEDDDADDEDTAQLILHKKRTRKTRRVNLNESDSQEEDPYGTDDDDEWQPSEGWLTNSEN